MIRRTRNAWRAAVRGAAVAVVGPRAASSWLSAPNASLGGVTPLTLAGDRRGAEMVIAELTRVRARGSRSAP